MKHYELLFVIKPTLTEPEIAAKFDFIKGVIELNGGEIKTVNDMGMRKLAYEIEKYERGHYFVVYFTAPTAAMDEVVRNLRLTEEIIRFLNVKFESKKEVAHWEKMAKSVGEKKEAKTAKESAPQAEEAQTPVEPQTNAE